MLQSWDCLLLNTLPTVNQSLAEAFFAVEGAIRPNGLILTVLGWKDLMTTDVIELSQRTPCCGRLEIYMVVEEIWSGPSRFA